MSSNIDKCTHKFWQKIAIVAGLFLVVEGMACLLIYSDDSFVHHLPRIIRIAIGAVTVMVDCWFLRYI